MPVLDISKNDNLDEAFANLANDENEITKRRKEGEKKVEGMTTEDYKKLRILCKTDLFFLCNVLGFTRLSPNLHGNLCKWMQGTKGDQYREILLPRGHFKSTIATIAHSIQIVLPDDSGEELWPLSLGTNCRLLIAHETAEQASRFLYAITAQFLGNPLLMALFPECVPNARKHKINKNELELPRSERWPEPTIDTMGVGGKSQGRHYNYLKLDDLFGDKARDSDAERKTTLDWFDNVQSFFSYHSKDKFDLVGTRWSLDDLYSHAHTAYGSELKKYIRPIEEFVKDSEGLVTKRIIFPEEFSEKKLEILKKNRKIYTAQYLNDPREGSNEFDPLWVRYFEWVDRYTIQPKLNLCDVSGKRLDDGPSISIADLDKLIFVDPAMTGDYGYVVTGTDSKKRNFVLNAIQKNWTPPKFVDFIFSEVMKWNPRFVGIESVLFSALYEHYFIAEQQLRNFRFKLEPFKIGNKEKPIRVSGLSPYFSGGQIFFHESQADLIEQYNYYGSIQEYHILDALANGPKYWRTPMPAHLRDSSRNLDNMRGRDAQTGYSSM
jgi:hypothetical protein